MKRSLFVLLVVCVASAVAGWVSAWARASYLERKSADAAEQARIVAMAEAKIPAQHIAALVREADEVVISFSGAKEVGETDIRFNDPAWLSQLGDVIEKASFRATPHGFWVSTPELRFYRNREQVLELTMLGEILRGYGMRGGGDFFVGRETTKAIRVLIQQKQPNQPPKPTRQVEAAHL